MEWYVILLKILLLYIIGTYTSGSVMIARTVHLTDICVIYLR